MGRRNGKVDGEEEWKGGWGGGMNCGWGGGVGVEIFLYVVTVWLKALTHS